jgi:hypothetical protein
MRARRSRSSSAATSAREFLHLASALEWITHCITTPHTHTHTHTHTPTHTHSLSLSLTHTHTHTHTPAHVALRAPAQRIFTHSPPCDYHLSLLCSIRSCLGTSRTAIQICFDTCRYTTLLCRMSSHFSAQSAPSAFGRNTTSKITWWGTLG